MAEVEWLIGGSSGSLDVGSGSDSRQHHPFVPRADVRFFHTPDGGEVEFINGQATMSDGLAAATYLSLFGGNEDDSGLEATERNQWWGNRLDTDPKRHYRSQVQHLLRNIPATPFNLRRIEDAARQDLAWMADELTATVNAEARITGLNHIAIDVVIDITGTTYRFRIEAPWGSE